MLAGSESSVRATAEVLSGYTVEGVAATEAEALVLRHLRDLGGATDEGTGRQLRVHGRGESTAVRIDWCRPDGRVDDEVTSQAAYGLMGVHGWATGGPRRLGVDYVSTVAGVVAVQGVLAALLSGLRGRPVPGITVSSAAATMLSVSQYLAAGSAVDSEYVPPAADVGRPPPFRCADGVWCELETLDPQPWWTLWTSLGASPATIGRAWKAFVLRYDTARSPLPQELHDIVSAVTYDQFVRAAGVAEVSVQPLRSHAERVTDLGGGGVGAPWTVVGQGSSTPPMVGLGTHDSPLSGVRVVEACRRVQGPLAGLILRLLGAEVVRVEPAGGDPLRGMPPMVGECSARFLALNRGKRVVEVPHRPGHGS